MINSQSLKRVFISKFATLFRINLIDAANNAKGIGLSNDGNKNGENYFLKNILPNLVETECPTCIDVGGNIGYYSAEILKCFPAAQIHVFEPNENTFKLLYDNFSSNANVVSNNLALGDCASTIDIYTYAHQNTSGHTSIYPGVFTDLHKIGKTITLQATQTTLDDYCINNQIFEIDFLKIDVEGHEHKVLQGARQLIKNNSIKVIQFEFNEMNVYSRVFLKDFYETLSNYTFYRILPDKLLPLGEYSPVNEVFKIQNIIAVFSGG